MIDYRTTTPLSKRLVYPHQGFTLIEIMVVIAIIGLLASIVLGSLYTANAHARDARRQTDINQIINALELYYDDNSRYPDGDGDGCGGWDTGNQTLPFLSSGVGQALPNPPEDPTATGNCAGYLYYRYLAGSNGCLASKGAYYVLGITNLEGIAGVSPDSPGFSCSGRNWQDEFEWVMGRYERG